MCWKSSLRQRCNRAAVRSGAGPASLILHTYSFSAHSKGDDPRSLEELAPNPQFDPLHGSGEAFIPRRVFTS